MATNDTSLCSTAEEITRSTTWIIKNFDYLMQESSNECLVHPTFEVQINPSAETSSNWNIRCWPNSDSRLADPHMRLTVSLVLLPRNRSNTDAALNVAVVAKLLDSAGNKVPLGEKTGRYKVQMPLVGEATGRYKVDSAHVLFVSMDHDKLLSSAERLMPGGTLTIYVEIKILPSLATVVHGSLQNVDPAQTAQALTPKNIFEDMVDNFVYLKLGSVLIVFQDGEQNCHAFPLAARNVFGEKF
jgi:hypothetical protein